MSRTRKKRSRKNPPQNAPPAEGPPADLRQNQWLTKRRCAVLGLLSIVLIASPFVWTYAHREWQLRQARLELADLKIQKAHVRLERLAKRQPNHPDVLFWLARAERRNGEVDEAIAHFTQAKEAGANEREIELQFQLMRAQAGRVKETEEFVRKFAEEADDLLSEEVYEALAQGFLYTGRFTEALDCLQFWIDWRPEYPRPRMYRAEAWEHNQNWRKAIAEYESILKLDPEHVAARREYARCLLRYKDAQSALKQYDLLLSKDPENTELQIGRYLALEKQGEIAKARNGYLELLRRDLDDDQREAVLNALGQLALYDGNPRMAKDYLEDAVKIAPHNSQTHSNLAAAYTRLDETEKAEKHQERARALLESQSRFDEILRQLLREPQNADLRFEAGELLVKLGMEDQAVAWWNSAAILHPDHAATHRKLEAYYRRQGKLERSRKHQQLAKAAE